MKVCVFDRVLTLRDNMCSLNGTKPNPLTKPYVNLYIQPTLKCNASCPFCEFKDNNCPDFDYAKFQSCLMELKRNRIEVRRVNITGGEPSLKLRLFHQITLAIKHYYPECFLGVNTNGSNISGLFEASEYVDTITVSHHHYVDSINSRLMGIDAPTLEMLSQYRDRLHLSCNLIKTFIWNKKSIELYLTECIKYGIKDVGFVALMKVNEYCEKHFVDFNDIFTQQTMKQLNVLDIRSWNNGDACKCKNYAYISNKYEDAVKFYARHYCKAQNNQSVLVFNGKNLTVGFDKTDIIY